MTSESLDQIATALCQMQGELSPAIKDSENPHLRNKYADLASCWDACRPLLPKYGLSIVQVGESVDGIHYLRTILLHKSGQFLSGTVPLIVGDAKGLNPMQALGSAFSYARRYGLAAIAGLTAEDDDGAGAGHPARRPATAMPSQARPAPTDGRDRPVPVAAPAGNGNGQQYGPPRSGKGLFAWSREHDAVAAVNAWGKANGLPSKMVEWTAEDAVACYEALTAREAGED